MSKTPEQGISDIIGALTDPIIVLPGGWGETLPDWLKDTITLERLLENMKALKGETPTGTDAEACAYLYTVSLTQPMPERWVRIYLYLATQVMAKWKKTELPDDIKVETISDNDLQELAGLKEFIYRKRVQHRGGKEGGERKETHEKAKEKGQPAKAETKANPQIKFF